MERRSRARLVQLDRQRARTSVAGAQRCFHLSHAIVAHLQCRLAERGAQENKSQQSQVPKRQVLWLEQKI